MGRLHLNHNGDRLIALKIKKAIGDYQNWKLPVS